MVIWRAKKSFGSGVGNNSRQRRVVRLLALAAAAVIGVSGLAPAAPAEAANSVAAGIIRVDAPNPVSYIYLNSDYTQQYTSRTLGGNAFYQNGGPPSAYPVVVDLATGANLTRSTGTRTFGGTGTITDPFWLETSGAMVSPQNTLVLTQRLSHVPGTEYMRNDISITNNGAATRSLQFGQFGDCYFNGSDSGTSNVEPGKMVQCIKGDKAMSLIDSSGGAVFAGGYFGGVRFAVQSPLVGTANADKCWVSSATIGSCAVNVDNGFGMAWATDIAPGETAVRTAYLSYTQDLAFVDLVPGSSVSTNQASIGETVKYTLSLRNAGPTPRATTSSRLRCPLAWLLKRRLAMAHTTPSQVRGRSRLWLREKPRVSPFPLEPRSQAYIRRR
ncbi:hypothetical protein G7067_04350 [Leucobacter insecticola]|uniref:DUF11 domain-containing protein n=1 Tax=Leucobacter insecticola TaxID=2714934 RepID=A0A6G8FH38_9MICO|nr:hypothetical protein [Leucobacter insecticola]QIM15816.1 hypothetical protein G7067_04350 [Leucobacter insecticola]